MKKLILIIAALFIYCNVTFAQDQTSSDQAKSDKTKAEQAKAEPFNKWEIGVNGGVGNLVGEYNMKNMRAYADWDSNAGAFGFGAFVKKNFSKSSKECNA